MYHLVPWRSKEVLQNDFVQSLSIESHVSHYLHDTLNVEIVTVVKTIDLI